MRITGKEIADACSGELLQGDPGAEITGFSIDSRNINQGSFFVPLKGDQEDGHKYVKSALNKGAAGSFYALKPLPDFPVGSLIIKVDDPLLALQQTAAAYRRRFDLPVVGVTGSSGKTTTKDLIAGVLSSKLKVLKTVGNYNNEIGLPLTLFNIDSSHRVAVLEMGMSAPGEITVLADMARPSFGVITNIGEAHLEQLGSIEAIAKAKGELLDYMGSQGTAILNGDDPHLLRMGENFPGKVYYYGFTQGDTKCVKLNSEGESSIFRVTFPDGQEAEFKLNLPGKHLVSNAMSALTLGWLFGFSPPEMQQGLRASELTSGRLQISQTPWGAKVIDDSYNANPGSVKASLQVLGELAGEKGIAVLGEMLELGPAAVEAHREVGRYAVRCGLHKVVTVGTMAREIALGAEQEGGTAQAWESHEDAVDSLRNLHLNEGWYILVKGSRGARMEKVVEGLLELWEGDRR